MLSPARGGQDAVDLRLAGAALAIWLSALAALRLPLLLTGCVAVGSGLAALALATTPAGWPARREPGRAGRPRAGWARGRRPRAGWARRRWPAGWHRTGGSGRPRQRPGAAAAGRGPGGWWGRVRWPGGWRWVLVGMLLGVVCGSTATAARVAARDGDPVAGLARQRASVEVDLIVRDDPHRLAATGGRPSTYLVDARLTGLTPVTGGARDAAAVRVSVRILVLASSPSWHDLLPGQRIRARGRLAQPRGGDLTAAVLAATGAPSLVGEPPWIQRAAGVLRAGLQRACAPLADEPGGLLPGLVVGDTSRLDPAVADDFLATGMTHLTAVSGSNVAIVVGAVLLLARGARASPRLSAGACAVALVGFVILARPSPSVLRAAAMGTFGLIALAAGRPRAAVPALCATTAVLVLIDPALASDAGFALSVLATGGLLLVAPGWRDRLRQRGVPAGAAEALAVPAAAQLACAPVVAAISSTVSLVAVPANLLAVPAVAPATVLGVLAAVVSPVWPAAAEFTAWLGGWPAWWLVLVARYGAGLPAGVLPWPGGVAGGLLLAVLAGAVLLAARHRLVRRLAGVVAAAVVVGALPVRLVASGWPPPDWVLVVCAVGQGDAAVLPVGPGQAVVVDAGPEPAATDGCLRRLGVRTVPLLVISHFHADHVGGIGGVFRGRTVGGVLTTAWPEPADGRAAVLRAAAAHGVTVRAVTGAGAYPVGGVRLSVVGPPHRLAGTRSDPNNNSLVVRASVHGVRVLLAGDAEREEQEAMLARAGAAEVAADVLKVAHQVLALGYMTRRGVGHRPAGQDRARTVWRRS